MDNKQRKAVFFDRDGTLNVDVHYLHEPKDFVWTEGAREAIKYVREQGFLAVVVTNQSGVARGYFPEADVVRLHAWMNEELKKAGTKIDGFYYCPHHPEAKVKKYRKDCECRKPKPGLILEAAGELSIDLAQSLMVGDKPRDVECGEAAGCGRSLLYEGGSLLALLKKVI